MVLMLFYWAAAAALISFSYFVAAFFSRTQLASLLSPLIYFLAMLPAFLAVSFRVRPAPLCMHAVRAPLCIHAVRAPLCMHAVQAPLCIHAVRYLRTAPFCFRRNFAGVNSTRPDKPGRQSAA